jgi:hypothetical protein
MEQVARDRRVCGWIMLCWQVVVILGCAYVVFWKGASGWWFALAIVFAMGKCKVRDDDTGKIVE